MKIKTSATSYSDKALFINYANLGCIIQKIDGCKNSPENSSTTKVNEHIPSGFSMSAISLFRSKDTNHNILIEYKCLSCSRSYQRKFYEKLKEQFFDTCKFS